MDSARFLCLNANHSHLNLRDMSHPSVFSTVSNLVLYRRPSRKAGVRPAGSHLRPRSLIAAAILTALTACGGGNATDDPRSGYSPEAQLGEQIFQDASLSASGKMSCQTCHAPETGHASASGLPAEMGGADLSIQGGRLSPGIRYLRFNSAFHFEDDGTPTGGFFWDGRADTLEAQAAGPFLNPKEMAMPSKAAVIDQLKRASYATNFERIFGPGVLNNVDTAYDKMTYALAQFEKQYAQFSSFSSKYDAYLAGRATLTAQEARGLALFESPTKGNCAGCHTSEPAADGAPPLFTDFTYDALGVPRNPDLRQNDDPNYFDLGLCARGTGDVANRPDLCGAFKVPSLRNVALRKRYFHNGRFSDLRQVVEFYVTRDTAPERWYPLVNGVPQKFNDLPPQYQSNVNTDEVPYNRNVGDAPALSDPEIDDVVAFLRTLSDGWVSDAIVPPSRVSAVK
jgi:cytochrome c peroxidase